MKRYSCHAYDRVKSPRKLVGLPSSLYNEVAVEVGEATKGSIALPESVSAIPRNNRDRLLMPMIEIPINV